MDAFRRWSGSSVIVDRPPKKGWVAVRGQRRDLCGDGVDDPPCDAELLDKQEVALAGLEHPNRVARRSDLEARRCEVRRGSTDSSPSPSPFEVVSRYSAANRRSAMLAAVMSTFTP
ncbi:hypothetical protein QJS04_geneDACA001279 [Acorus gramineus]|uniref:Uncharacterized protein n=1 Tax=Acorus gramineus TaxID=55184 RepID=A0AAV9AEF6_ACOGR|nr:hypothetical protein QJS04_geneDACA001279 [Acorus gramineus]